MSIEYTCRTFYKIFNLRKYKNLDTTKKSQETHYQALKLFIYDQLSKSGAFPSQAGATGVFLHLLDPLTLEPIIPIITEEDIAESEQTFIRLLERKPAVDRLYQIKFIVSKAPNSILLDTATRINLLARSLLRFAWAGVFSILLPLSLYVADVILCISLELLGFAAVEKVFSLLLSAALLSTSPVFIIQIGLFILIALACACLGGVIAAVIGDFATATERMLRW